MTFTPLEILTASLGEFVALSTYVSIRKEESKQAPKPMSSDRVAALEHGNFVSKDRGKPE